MKELIGKADVLIEALPYIQKFRNSIMVVKFGGSAMEDPGLVESTMRDVVLLEAIGIRPIVVHGGGKAISAELRKQDIPVRFVNGLRYTCEKTIKIVDDVLHNQVNAALGGVVQTEGQARRIAQHHAPGHGGLDKAVTGVQFFQHLGGSHFPYDAHPYFPLFQIVRHFHFNHGDDCSGKFKIPLNGGAYFPAQEFVYLVSASAHMKG